MRCIHCPSCALKATFHSYAASEDGPAVYVYRVHGRASRPLTCDGCNDLVLPGQHVTAWTSYPANRPIGPWEHEYLIPLPHREEVP
jgi:hypothetical protein